MSSEVPQGATCAQHLESLATGVCPRCGGFFCAVCARRVREDSTPMCPKCWDLRAVKVPALNINKHGMQNAALVMGFIALIPAPEMVIWQVIAVIVSIVAMVKAEKGVLWRPIVGLVCSLIGFVLMIAVAAAH